MLLYLYSPDAEQEMNVVCYTRPGQTVGFRFGDHFREPVNEIQPIIIAPEYPPSFDPPDDHRMQRPLCVDSCFPRHGPLISSVMNSCKVQKHGRPNIFAVQNAGATSFFVAKRGDMSKVQC